MIKNKCFFLMFWSIHSFFKLISFEKIFSRFFSERKNNFLYIILFLIFVWKLVAL